MNDFADQNASRRDGANRDELQRQIDALKEQIASLTTTISERASQAKDKAADLYDAASDQARDIKDVARAYPVAVSSITLGGVVLGVLIGLALSHATAPEPRWYERRWH